MIRMSEYVRSSLIEDYRVYRAMGSVGDRVLRSKTEEYLGQAKSDLGSSE